MQTVPLVNTIRVAVLLIVSAMLTGCQPPARGRIAAQFDEAREQLHAGRFDAARQQLTSFVEDHAGHALSGRATFLLAKCYLGLGQFDNARLWFERTLQRYPDTEEAHKARFKLAMIQFLRNDPLQAKGILQELLDAPGPYLPEASAWLDYLEAGPDNGF